MPLFDVQCRKCGHKEEQLIKNHDVASCTNCGSEEVEKLIGTTNFQLRGDGWAKDLYSKPPHSVSPTKE